MRKIYSFKLSSLMTGFPWAASHITIHTSYMHEKKRTNQQITLAFAFLTSPHLSLNLEGRWGTTDDFTTSFLHFSLSSTALWVLENYRPVHYLMLSPHLFLCLHCLLPPFLEKWFGPDLMNGRRPYHCSLRLFTMIRSSCGPIACWILARIFPRW